MSEDENGRSLSDEEDSDKPECAICLQKCTQPVRLPCSHIFCYLCVKGVTQQSRKCAMCRQPIPANYLDKPNLLSLDIPKLVFDGNSQWFYEGKNGWWQYDERTSQEIETAYQKKDKECEVLIAGFLYIIDFESNMQYRRGDPFRRRKIKRDIVSIPKKGVAGIRLPSNSSSSTSDGDPSLQNLSLCDNSSCSAQAKNSHPTNPDTSAGKQTKPTKKAPPKMNGQSSQPTVSQVKAPLFATQPPCGVPLSIKPPQRVAPLNVAQPPQRVALLNATQPPQGLVSLNATSSSVSPVVNITPTYLPQIVIRLPILSSLIATPLLVTNANANASRCSHHNNLAAPSHCCPGPNPTTSPPHCCVQPGTSAAHLNCCSGPSTSTAHSHCCSGPRTSSAHSHCCVGPSTSFAHSHCCGGPSTSSVHSHCCGGPSTSSVPSHCCAGHTSMATNLGNVAPVGTSTGSATTTNNSTANEQIWKPSSRLSKKRSHDDDSMQPITDKIIKKEKSP